MPKNESRAEGHGVERERAQKGGEQPCPPSDLGPQVSDSTRRARWICRVEEHETHPGETLATRNHDVIVRWAEERQAVPATVPDTRKDGRPGVLRFDFPGYGDRNLEQVSWEDWFRTFDERDLIFLFQEHMRDGRASNFFHMDSPHREQD